MQTDESIFFSSAPLFSRWKLTAFHDCKHFNRKKLMDKFFCVASINMSFMLPRSIFNGGWSTWHIFLQLRLYKGREACCWHNKFMESWELKYELLKRTLVLSLLLLYGKLLGFIFLISFSRETDQKRVVWKLSLILFILSKKRKIISILLINSRHELNQIGLSKHPTNKNIRQLLLQFR